MKKILTISLFVFFTIINLQAQNYTGPIPKPTSGYGSDGTFTVDTIQFSNPAYPNQKSIIFYPQGISSPVPTIFFCHGGGADSALYYLGFFKFIAQKGYASVFVPYNNSIAINDRYDLMKTGFSYASRNYSLIDTTKVGFVGHSFGGGMSIAVSHHFFSNYNWGSNGRFLMPIAQFYSFQLSQSDLQNYPSDTKMLSIIYDDDDVNDHRMAIDIFNNINIPNTEKDIVYIKSSDVGTYSYLADHNAIATHNYFDALDYYAVYRPLDALMDYVFNGNTVAKNVCLGDGSASQVAMPAGMESLVVTDTITSWRHPESYFDNPCSIATNPRAQFCGGITNSINDNVGFNKLILYPNPSSDIWQIELDNSIQHISILDLMGKIVRTIKVDDEMHVKIDVSNFSAGIYAILITDSNGNTYTSKGIKE